jgi:hypothetical protein
MTEREKRIHPRTELLQSISYDVAMLKRSVETVETVAADILNISTGGVCIMTEKTHEPGKVIRLNLPHKGTDIPVPSLAEVKWVDPANARFKMGLEFLM